MAALISEVDLSARLGSPGHRKAHREILDATAAEVPVLPLRFGTVLASEDAVTEDLLAAHRDEFAAALQKIEGRAEFLVEARYLEGVPANRQQDTRALEEAVQEVCVASAVCEPARELAAIRLALLVDVGRESELERMVKGLARDWQGRAEVELLGPMAAYDFAGTTAP